MAGIASTHTKTVFAGRPGGAEVLTVQHWPIEEQRVNEVRGLDPALAVRVVVDYVVADQTLPRKTSAGVARTPLSLTRIFAPTAHRGGKRTELDKVPGAMAALSAGALPGEQVVAVPER